MLHKNIAVDLFDCFVYNQPAGKKQNPARDYCALSYRLDTDCKYTYSGKTLQVPKGSLAFVPNGVAYNTLASQGSICVIHFHILNYSYKDLFLINEGHSAEIHTLFMQCIEDWENKPTGYQYKVTSAFYKILELAASSSSKTDDTSQDILSMCTSYIEEHFMKQSLTVKEIAEHAHISETYLRQIFHKALSVSPKDYLTNKRIQFAKYLLGTGYFQQCEIAGRCGFSDVKYFRYAFKKQTGMTIREYAAYQKEKLAKSRE